VNAGWQIRRGTGADADGAAEVYLRAPHHAVPQIPALVHPDDEVRLWMRGVLEEHEAWLACAGDGTLLGLMVLEDARVGQLYLDPAWTGRGLGTYFLEMARQQRPDGLQLRTFVSNVRARRFYERNGFIIQESRSAPTRAAMRSTHPISATPGGLTSEKARTAPPDP
jgi:GNAT superfamily N-acetyltransferase